MLSNTRKGSQQVDAVGNLYEQWMLAALKEAEQAQNKDEVPVGAVMVHENKIIASAHNTRETTHNPLAHAEIIAIEQTAKLLGRWRLLGCTLVVTLEPCVMCAGAIVNARLDRVIFAADDPRAGAAGSLFNVLDDVRLNHRPMVVNGVCAEESSKLLKAFFANKRRAQKTCV